MITTVNKASIARVLLLAIAALSTILQAQTSSAQPPITSLALTPSADAFLSGSQAGLEVHTWPNISSATKHDVQIEQIQDLQFSPNGKRLLIVGGQPSELGEWKVVDWPDLSVVASNTEHDDVIYSAVWLSDNKFVTGAADNQVIEWQIDGKTSKIIRRLNGHSRRVLAVDHCKQANLIVSAGRGPEYSGLAHEYRASARNRTCPHPGQPHRYNS